MRTHQVLYSNRHQYTRPRDPGSKWNEKYLTEGSCEQARILQNNSDGRSQIIETHLRNVLAVNEDLPLERLQNPQKRHHNS